MLLQSNLVEVGTLHSMLKRAHDEVKLSTWNKHLTWTYALCVSTVKAHDFNYCSVISRICLALVCVCAHARQGNRHQILFEGLE